MYRFVYYCIYIYTHTHDHLFMYSTVDYRMSSMSSNARKKIAIKDRK